MSLEPGTRTFGPQNAELLVHTRRAGAAAKAGHDLVIEVTSWSGSLEVGDGGSPRAIILSAEGASLRVREGTGGIQALGDDDKASIRQSIDEEVLRGSGIEFRSTTVHSDPGGEHLHGRGELEMVGGTGQVGFELTISPDGKLTGAATVKQSDWGIEPYTILFGTLKVADEVGVTFQGKV